MRLTPDARTTNEGRLLDNSLNIFFWRILLFRADALGPKAQGRGNRRSRRAPRQAPGQMVALTEQLALSRARAESMADVRSLNLWGNGLTEVCTQEEGTDCV